MPVKKYNPTTPSTRFRVGTDFSGLSNVKPEKSLLKKINSTLYILNRSYSYTVKSSIMQRIVSLIYKFMNCVLIK